MKPQTAARIVLGLAAVVLAGNAIFQLARPQDWYWAIPGVSLTGPYNPHFVRDIGAAYVAVVLGFAWFAWKPRQGWPALVAAAIFLTLHAVIHVRDEACSADPFAAVKRDAFGIHFFALLALASAFFFRPKESQA
jgi:hypothetical protein